MTNDELTRTLADVTRNAFEQLQAQKVALCDLQSRVNALSRILEEVAPTLEKSQAEALAKYVSYQREYAAKHGGRLQSSC
jgi:hypothetical protein